MSDRPVIQPSSEPSRPIPRAGLAQAHPFAVDVDRRKRIDAYIDYFGNDALSSQLAAPSDAFAKVLDQSPIADSPATA